MLRHRISSEKSLHAHWLRAIVARPLRWTPTRVRRHTLSAVQALDLAAHGFTACVACPLRGTSALDGARGIRAVPAVSTRNVAHWCGAVRVKPANIARAGVWCTAGSVNASLHTQRCDATGARIPGFARACVIPAAKLVSAHTHTHTLNLATRNIIVPKKHHPTAQHETRRLAYAPQGTVHTGLVQSWPVQPDGQRHNSSATHRPPFSHI
jgi:hypothetical protein